MAKATTEQSVVERLQNLYALQLIDSEIDEIAVLKGELPIEVQDLEDEIAGLQTRIDRLQNTIQDMERDINNHKSNINEAEALRARYETQMDNVKNNREYDALSKEIELQKLEIQLSEKKIREIGSLIDGKEQTLAANEERKAGKVKDLEVKKVELEKIIAKTEKQEKKLQKERKKAADLVQDRLLVSYNRIRTAYRNGLGVVTVERNSCGGCFNKIPPQVQLEISQHKRIIACEHCGRVLVDEAILEVGKKAEA